ncbi:TadE/TadG family type IV pilus assembly protein [Yoonia sp. BS5-3]|uniref:TadE/TadG family type IV pilus assembly protein n=1 Tax=Yoonia phaeophyticola TaxID=3137369 RepID=A0ABZ2V7E1_9RHOB
MMSKHNKLRELLRNFRRDEDGVVTLEFVIIFPVFFFFFLMTIESGIISLQHFRLERAVDLTVRDIRIGEMRNPTRQEMLESICDIAATIPNCEAEVEIELIVNDLRNWTAVDGRIQCIDRGEDPPSGDSVIPTGGDNELMYMRVCARIDPLMPTTGLGKAIVDGNSGSAAAGSYALVSTAAFVIEPFGSD